jgi:hypothetical protein
MEILLAFAVAAVGVASCIIAVKFRTGLRDSATRLQVETAQLTSRYGEEFRQAEIRLSTQHDLERRTWLEELGKVREQVRDAQARVSQAGEQARDAQARVGQAGEQAREAHDLLAGQGEVTGQLQAGLESEAQSRQAAIQRLHVDLQQEVQDRQEEIQQLRQNVRGELASQLRGSVAADADRRERAVQQLTQAVRDLEMRGAAQHKTFARVQGELAEHRLRADRQLLAAARDLSYLDQRLGDIRSHVRQQLDREVAAKGGVLAGGIWTSQAAAAEILPRLYAAFCRALQLKTVFRDPRGAGNVRFYLLWTSPTGTPLQRRLELLLRAGPDDAAEFRPGLTELRILLVALHNAGPATFQLGPIIVSRTYDGLLGGVLTAAEVVHIDRRRTRAPMAGNADILASLDAARRIDLAPWADRYAS